MVFDFLSPPERGLPETVSFPPRGRIPDFPDAASRRPLSKRNDAVSSAFFRLVHPASAFLSRESAWRHSFHGAGHAYAHGDPDRMSFVYILLFCDCLPDPFRKNGCMYGFGLRQDAAELLPSVSGHDIHLSDRGLDGIAHGFQDEVAADVAVGVVDFLEMVDVDQHDRQVAAVSVLAFHFLRQPHREEPVVECVREGISEILLDQHCSYAAISVTSAL